MTSCFPLIFHIEKYIFHYLLTGHIKGFDLDPSSLQGNGNTTVRFDSRSIGMTIYMKLTWTWSFHSHTNKKTKQVGNTSVTSGTK